MVSAPRLVKQTVKLACPVAEANRGCAPWPDVGDIIARWDELAAKNQGQHLFTRKFLSGTTAHNDCRSKLDAVWADIDACRASVEADNKAEEERVAKELK